MSERFATLEDARAYFDEHKSVAKSFSVKAEETEEGSIRAVFSVFNELDSDGDVVLASAFRDGQKVPLVWSHQWDRPIGKGVIHVQEDRAVFDGKFFLDTEAGSEAYKIVKNMDDLQEYSWGFRILDYDVEELADGEESWWGYKRIIKEAEVYEVSPVLVGANRNTRTLSVKSLEPSMKDLIEEVVKNYLDEHFGSENTDEHNVTLSNSVSDSLGEVVLSFVVDGETIYSQTLSDLTKDTDEIEEETSSDVEEHSEEDDLEKQARQEVAKYFAQQYEHMEALS